MYLWSERELIEIKSDIFLNDDFSRIICMNGDRIIKIIIGKDKENEEHTNKTSEK